MSSKFFSILLIVLCAMAVANAIPTRMESWTRVLSSYNRYSNMTNIHTPTLHKRKKDDKGKGGGGKEPKGTVDGVAVHYDPKEGEGNLSCLGEGAAHKLKNMMVVAVNTGQLSDSMCNRKMKVQYKTESIIVKVVDECEDCEEGLIDLSEEAFEKLAPLDDGKIKVKWTMLP